MIFKFILLILINQAAWAAADSNLHEAHMKWTDEKSQPFLMQSMAGKKMIMAMAYTTCQGTCPMIVSKLKKVEKLFEQSNIPHEVVIVTYDPAIDTPARQNNFYREKMGLKKESWHFLNGSDSDTKKLSLILGIRYAKNPESGMINHENKIFVIDEKGSIQGYVTLDEDEAKFLKIDQ